MTHTLKRVGRGLAWLGTTRGGLLAVVFAVALLASIAPHAALASPLVGVAGVTSPYSTDTTDLSAAMKVLFDEPLINNVVTDSELMSLFQTDFNVKEEETTGGRYVEMAHYLALPAGVGARGEGEYIPIPDAPKFANSRLYLKKVQGTIEMTGDTMRRVRNSATAFLDYAERALPDLVERVTSESDRMYCGYGWGVKARIANVTGTYTLGGTSTSITAGLSAASGGKWWIVIDRAFGITGYEDAIFQFLEGDRLVATSSLSSLPITLKNAGSLQSMKVEDMEDGSTPQSSGAPVQAIQVSGDSALLAALAANDYLGSGDAAGNSLPAGSPAVEREFTGLLAHVDDGGIMSTYFNVPRASTRLFRSVVIDASASPWSGVLSEDLMVYADEEVATKGGGKPDVVVSSRSGARGYWKSLKGDRVLVDPRAYVGGMSAQGTKRGLSIVLPDRELQLRVARKLPPQVAFGIETKGFRRFTLGKWEWDDRTGALWNRVTDATGRKDSFYATGQFYENCFNSTPRRCWRTDNLSRQY